MSRGTRKRILRKYDAKKRGWLHAVERFFLLLFLCFLFFRFVIGVSIVSGRSMMDTLNNGDVVVFTRIHGQVERGDVVAVSLPSGDHYVKRVVATGGDTVDLRDGVLYVNGEPENDERIKGETLAEEGAFAYPLTVQEGDLFVLGDNREESIDSRFFGSISSFQIEGVLKLRIGKFFIQKV